MLEACRSPPAECLDQMKSSDHYVKSFLVPSLASRPSEGALTVHLLVLCSSAGQLLYKCQVSFASHEHGASGEDRIWFVNYQDWLALIAANQPVDQARIGLCPGGEHLRHPQCIRPDVPSPPRGGCDSFCTIPTASKQQPCYHSGCPQCSRVHNNDIDWHGSSICLPTP